MITTNATITDVRFDGKKLWIELRVDGKYFPVHHEFDLRYIGDYYKVSSIFGFTDLKNFETSFFDFSVSVRYILAEFNSLKGKTVRVIDTEESHHSLIAIGHPKKNRFIDLHKVDDFTVWEQIIYWRYRKKK